MTEVEMKIFSKAVRIRVDSGEEPRVVLNSYTKLSDEEKYQILKGIKEGQYGR